MIATISKFILLLFSIVVALFLAIIWLRYMGQSQSFGEFTHPLINNKYWLIADGGDQDFGPDQSLTALTAANKISSEKAEVFLGIKIRPARDGAWVLYAPGDLSELTSGHGFIGQFNLSELLKLKIKNTNDSLLSLDEAFAKFPKAKFYIDVIQPSGTNLAPLFDLIKKYKLEERVVLSSPYISTLQQLRNENPAWLTGVSTSELASAKLMTAIYLETMLDIRGDVFIFHKLNIRLFDELTRRHKILIFSTENVEKFSDLKKAYPNIGIVTKRPSYFLQTVEHADNSH